jgi:hypothetical protein
MPSSSNRNRPNISTRTHRPQSGPAEVLNSRRFLTLDLNYGRRVDSEMYEYLMDNGMTREEYHFFLGNRSSSTASSATIITRPTSTACTPMGRTEAAGETFGYCEITRQYHNRYRLPIMHTETNLREGPDRAGGGAMAVEGMGQRPAAAQRRHPRLSASPGISLTDQVDWDTALREKNGNVNPLGLFDLNRNIRNVGKAYKQLIKDWRDVLPASSVCLAVPIKPIGQNCWPPAVTVSPNAAEAESFGIADIHPGTEAA